MTIPTVTFNSGIEMPMIGLGTWLLNGKECERAMKMALDLGYRHIDTAHLYNNHKDIGKAIHGFPREELFLTSKFLIDQLGNFRGENKVEQSCDLAIDELGCDYLDLFLIHFPDRSLSMATLLTEMEKLITKGKVRAIGVSNFTIHHLQDLLKEKAHFSVNQVEFHPFLYQKELLEFCEKHGILLVSYRTLGKGELLKEKIFRDIGEKYGKSAAQILLRWTIEKEIPVIPKSASKRHLKENIEIFDFTLSKEDTEVLDSLNASVRYCKPEWSDFEY